jgi:hypothetical protein
MSVEPDKKLTNQPNLLGEIQMKATLTIKDLSANKELDRKAMCAVRGGSSDQGIANQQFNGQAALVNSSIADGSKFCGPTNIQADTDVHQDAENYSYNDNFKALSLFGGLV